MSQPDLFQRLDPIRLVLWGLCLVFIHQLVASMLHLRGIPLLVNVTLSAGSVLVALPLLHLKSYRANWVSTLRIHPLALSQMLWLCILALSLIPLGIVLSTWNSQIVPSPPTMEEFYAEMIPTGIVDWILTVLTVGMLAPIGEEIVFRGIIQQACRRPLGGFWAAAATAALFGLVHFEPWFLLGLLLVGLVLSFSFEATGSLIAPVVIHMIYNIGVIGVAWWQHNRFEDLEIGWAVAVGTATGCALLAWYSYTRLKLVRGFPAEAQF